MICNRQMRLGAKVVINRSSLEEMVQQCQVYEKLGYEAVAPYQKKQMYKAKYNKKVTKSYGIVSHCRYIIYMERKKGDE